MGMLGRVQFQNLGPYSPPTLDAFRKELLVLVVWIYFEFKR